MIWKIKQTLNQVNPRTSRNGVIQTKRIPWNTAECKYDIILKQKPQIGLNRFVREENVSTMRIQPYSFCEEPQTSKPKLEIQYMLQFLFHNNCDHTKPIFLQWSYANQDPSFSGSKEHLQKTCVGEERVTNPLELGVRRTESKTVFWKGFTLPVCKLTVCWERNIGLIKHQICNLLYRKRPSTSELCLIKYSSSNNPIIYYTMISLFSTCYPKLKSNCMTLPKHLFTCAQAIGRGRKS